MGDVVRLSVAGDNPQDLFAEVVAVADGGGEVHLAWQGRLVALAPVVGGDSDGPLAVRQIGED